MLRNVWKNTLPPFSRSLAHFVGLAFGGLLLGVSLNEPALWYLSFPALLISFSFLEKVSTRKNRTVFSHWFFFGFVYIATAHLWFWDTLPLDWLGVENPFLAHLLVCIYWATVSAALALGVGLFGLVFTRLKTGRVIPDAFLGGLLWVFFEYLRMWFFAVLNTAPGIPLEPHYSFAFLGYIIAAEPNLLQIARFGGVYSLSFFLFFAAFFAFYVWKNVKLGTLGYRESLASLLLLIFFIVPVFIPERDEHLSEKELSVAAITTNFPSLISYSPEDEISKYTAQKNLLEQAIQSSLNPEVVIFPEDSRFLKTALSSGEEWNQIRSFLATEKIFLIDSGRQERGDRVYGEAYYFNASSRETAVSRKRILVPQGEYQPSFYFSILQMLGRGDLVKKIEDNRTYTPGIAQVGEFKGVNIGTLFCYELFSPTLSRTLVEEQKADVLVILSSQSWFHHSRSFYNQTIAAAKVRAVENNRPLIQASNGAPSFVIDRSGRKVKETSGILYVDF